MTLLLAAVVAPLLAFPAAAFAPRVYEANTVIGSSDPYFLVYSGESVAQSFTASATYILLNLTLRLKNDGAIGNLVNITIRPDATGVPSSTLLAWANVQAGITVGPVNVPLTPTPTVDQGQVYWIVATKGGSSIVAYEWHHSGADTYAGGKAMLNTGSGWTNPGSPTDMWFLTYGLQTDANVTVAMSASPTRALPKASVTFTVYVNNTGTVTSPKVWLNDTLPSGLTFVSDTSGAVPAVTGFPNYTFADLANGTYSFALTATVDVGVAPGTTLTNRVALAFTNATGALGSKRSASASVLIGLQWKQLYLVPGNPGPPQSLVPDAPTGGSTSQVVDTVSKGGAAVPFQLQTPLSRTLRMMSVTVVLYLDSKSHKVANLDMNFTLLDVSGATQTAVAYDQLRVTTDGVSGYQMFSFPFPTLDLSFATGHQVLLQIKDMATSQDDALLATNATATPSQMDVLTPTYVHVDALELRDAFRVATVWSPKDSLVVHANVSDPFGTGEIANAWINVTDPTGGQTLTLAPMSLLGSGASGWKLYGTTVGAPLANGTYRIEVMVEEGNGVLAYATGQAPVCAPALGLVLVPTQSSAQSGDTFFFAIWYNNTGSGPARRAWINVTLPSQLIFVTSSAEANRTGPTRWTWQNVSVGSHFFLLEVTVRSGIPPAPSMLTTAGLNETDLKGYLWPAHIATAAVILQGPILSLTFSSSTSTIHANETFVLTSTLHNSGDASGTVWLNLSWSAGLAYVADSSVSVGGTSTPTAGGVAIRWTSLGSGVTLTVNVSLQGGSGLPRGLSLAITAGLNDTNTRGAPMPSQVAARSVKVIAPSIVNATIRLGQILAVPGDIVPVTLNFTNAGDEAALSLVVTLVLDANLAVRNASLPITVTGSAALLALSNVGLGTRRIFLNLTVARGAPDRSLLAVSGPIVYTDRLGNPQPLVRLNVASMTVTAPAFAVYATPGNPTVEAGTPVTFRVVPANLGTGRATRVWLNATLPLDFLYVSDSSDGLESAIRNQVSWYWPIFSSGPRAFNLTLEARGSVANGTTEVLALSVAYADANGNPHPAVNATIPTLFLAPAIQLSLSVSTGQVVTQTTFLYTVRLQSVGSTRVKTLWLLDAVDTALDIFSYTSSVTPTGTQTLNWTYLDLEPNEAQTITLSVQVQPGVAVGARIPNFLAAVFTNSQGQIVGAAQSNLVTVTVVEPSATWALLLVGAIAAGGAVAFVVYRRRNSRIEEVFVITRDGILVDHLARSLIQDQDPDVVSGMLTGIQHFVRDAFKFGEDRSLHQLEFGDYHVLLERGKDIYLAVVTSGKDVEGVEAKVKKVLAQIEAGYGAVLATFDGDMDKILGVRELLRRRLLR